MDVTQHSKDTMYTHTNSPFKNSNLCAGQQEVLSDLTQIVKKNFNLSEVQTALNPLFVKPDTNEVTKYFIETVSMTPAPPPVQFSTELWDKFPTSESEYEDIQKNSQEEHEHVIKPKPKKKKYQCSLCGNTGHYKPTCPRKHNKHCSFCGETGHNIQTCSLKAWKDEVDETIEQHTLAQLG